MNVIPQVGLASFFLFDGLLSQRGDGVFDRNIYLIRILNGKAVSVWFPFLDDSPVKIKRRITEDATEDSNVHVGSIPPTTGLWLDRENNVVWFDYPHKYYTLIADSGCDYMNGLDYTPKPPFKPLITATEIINKQEEA